MTDTSKLIPFMLSVKLGDKSTTRKITIEQADWGDQSDNLYFVDINEIERLSAEVRKSLRRFVGQCMDSRSGGVARSGAHLKDLAQHGNNLYWALFDNVSGQPEPAQYVRDLVSQAAGSYRMNVSVDDRTYIPWGLVYDGDPTRLSGDPGDVDIGHYADFWCLKYLVSCTYTSARVRALAAPKSVSIFKLISALHKDAFTSAESLLAPGEPETQVLGWLRELFSGTKAFDSVYTKGELFDSWGTNAELDMLFFYCHANPTSVAFSGTELLEMTEINDFKRRLALQRGQKSPSSACLFFMNGCSTAVGDPGGGFLEVSGRHGSCGFIGTETEVPDLYAFRFGLGFLYHFLKEGRPVYEVMDKMRRQHWPLSLVYSTYCSPVLRVAPPTAPAAPQVDFGNFSDKRLGTTERAVI